MHFLLHHLVDDTAEAAAERVAIREEGTHWTYGAFRELGQRLAAVLQALGTQRGDRVGLYLEKSAYAVIGIYGVLKSGAAYVPIDPHAPADRVGYILRDAGVRTVVTSPARLARLAEIPDLRGRVDHVIVAGTEDASAPLVANVVPWREVETASPSPSAAATIDEDLAYVLYTSGSTGRPKGVMISHRAALTFVHWALRTFDLRAEDRFSSHAPLHFDLSIFDLFAAFGCGASVSLVPETCNLFPVRLAQWIRAEAITVWYSVPSALTMLVRHGGVVQHDFPSLRLVLFAGEVFPVKYLRQLMDCLPHATFYNLYGPTETNVITYYRVPPLEPDRTEPIPIGQPCDNTHVLVLNEEGRPVTEPGVRGELYARGSILAEGYLGDPEKTRTAFLLQTTPWGAEQRVYRTGDIVEFDVDGNLLFRGRRDHMVKSRGYRIELGEIEAALYAHPSVKEAAAVPIPDELIGNRIRAFVVTDGSLDPKDLLRFCAARLPKYMVPEAIELRDGLPRTSTGKVDRHQLTQEAAQGKG